LNCRATLLAIITVGSISTAVHAQGRNELGPTLTRLAVERNVQILFQPRLVEGLVANPVRRGSTLDQAMTAIIGRQGLKIRKVRMGVYAVEPEARRASPLRRPPRKTVRTMSTQ
jgi:hypothetical protein